MERIYEYKGVVFGYTLVSSVPYLIAYKDGISKVSFSDFDVGESVIKFFEYNNALYAALSDLSTNCRILRLDVVNTLALDTWTEVWAEDAFCLHSTVFFGGYVYLFLKGVGDTVEAWKFNGTTVVLVCADLSDDNDIIQVWDAISTQDKIYIYGYDDSSLECLYEYDGDVTIAQLFAPYVNGIIKLPVSFIFIGSKRIEEYKGKVYYYCNNVVPTGVGVLRSWDIEQSEAKDEWIFTLPMSTMKLYNGMILVALYDSINNLADVKVFVIDEYIIENDLPSGEGAVHSSLIRIDSDPIFLVKDATEKKMNPYSTYPAIAVLKGKLNPIIKYGNRIECYTDLNNVTEIIEKNIKDLMDELCTITDNTFQVDGQNVANIKRRDIVGNSDSFMTIKNNNEYGNNMIKGVVFADQQPTNFKRIVVNWNNKKYADNNAVVSGSSDTKNYATFEFDSAFINNPILAKNLGIYMLNKLAASEHLIVDLSFSHFLEGGENLVFDVSEGYVYIDDSKEWKLVKVAHNLKEKTTRLEFIERTIMNEVMDI
jgi:hypothetical protein